MKKTLFYFLSVTLSTFFLMIACNDPISSNSDEKPDPEQPEQPEEPEEPENPPVLLSLKEIQKIITNSYPVANWGWAAELSADNLMENIQEFFDIDLGKFFTSPVDAFDPMDVELFEWKVVSGNEDEDSPFFIWESFYTSIAGANKALNAIELIKTHGDESALNLNPLKGEALLLRAYCHFVLTNIFCLPYKNSTASQQDPGIVYLTDSVNTVNWETPKKSLAAVYSLIEKDLEEGLALIDNPVSLNTKYHFTPVSANAFASQFYLYKRNYPKVIEYANKVLGSGDCSSLLRDWTISAYGFDEQRDAYFSDYSPANLLMISTYSLFLRHLNNKRYGYSTKLRGSIYGDGPTWRVRPHFLDGQIFTYGQDYGIFTPKVGEYYEYIDENSGYSHILRAEFTTDDCLLNRAEAKIMTGDISGGLQDLEYWNKSHKGESNLTDYTVNTYYVWNRTGMSFPFHTTELSSDFIITDEQKPYIDCVLHFRRLERSFEGHRWLDLKRYGVNITKQIGSDAEKIVLAYDDSRRALQLSPNMLRTSAYSQDSKVPTVPVNENKMLLLK